MKHFLVFLFSVLLSVQLYSQRTFFRAGLSYGLPLSNSQPVYMTGFPYTGGNASPGDAALFEVKKASMFSGPRVSAGAGFMFAKIGAEVAVTMPLSPASHSASRSLGGIYAPGSETTVTQAAKNPFLLIPSAVMNIPGKKMDILIRAGISLPLSSKMEVESETISGSDKFYDRSELRTRFSFGFAFSGGIEYKITKKLRANASIDIITMTLKAKELVLVSSTVNGNEVSQDKLAYEKKTLYVEDISGYTFSSDQPRQQQVYSIPFGTKGISLGLSVSL